MDRIVANPTSAISRLREGSFTALRDKNIFAAQQHLHRGHEQDKLQRGAAVLAALQDPPGEL